MSDFSQFRKLQFPEQFQMLQEVEGSKDPTAYEHLFSLVESPLGDEVMDSMIQETLKKLLSDSQEWTTKGLQSTHPNLKKLAVQVCGDTTFELPASELRAMALDREEPFFEILTACSHYDAETMLPVFQKHIADADPLVATMCIDYVGKWKDETSLPALFKAVCSCDEDPESDSCELIAGEAILALSAIGLDECFIKLTNHVHHYHPVLRRFVHKGLIQGGTYAVQFLKTKFLEGNHDEKIMVANILGEIGGTEAGMALFEGIQRIGEPAPAVRHAVYEAFGKIHVREGVEYLLQGLNETDMFLLLCVIHSLDLQVNSGVLMQIRKLLKEDPERYDILIEAIVTARAMNLFKKLYKDRNLQTQLLRDLERSGDPFLMSEFLNEIPEMPREPFEPYLNAKKERCFLVVDDSPSMLRYLRSLLTDEKTEVVVAENGQMGVEVLEKGTTVHLIISDMNMPIMNGVEMTRKIKGNLIFGHLPIIMVTTESDRTQKEIARESGVDEFITKPFKPEELKEKIDAILS